MSLLMPDGIDMGEMENPRERGITLGSRNEDRRRSNARNIQDPLRIHQNYFVTCRNLRYAFQLTFGALSIRIPVRIWSTPKGFNVANTLRKPSQLRFRIRAHSLTIREDFHLTYGIMCKG